MSRVGNIAIAT